VNELVSDFGFLSVLSMCISTSKANQTQLCQRYNS
jgi:hypothetical protein